MDQSIKYTWSLIITILQASLQAVISDRKWRSLLELRASNNQGQHPLEIIEQVAQFWRHPPQTPIWVKTVQDNSQEVAHLRKRHKSSFSRNRSSLWWTTIATSQGETSLWQQLPRWTHSPNRSSTNKRKLVNKNRMKSSHGKRRTTSACWFPWLPTFKNGHDHEVGKWPLKITRSSTSHRLHLHLIKHKLNGLRRSPIYLTRQFARLSEKIKACTRSIKLTLWKKGAFESK